MYTLRSNDRAAHNNLLESEAHAYSLVTAFARREGACAAIDAKRLARKAGSGDVLKTSDAFR